MPSSKSKSIPIPYTETQKVESGFDQIDASRLNQMYESATWRMYDRIVNARKAKTKRRLEQVYAMTGYVDQSVSEKAAVASKSEKKHSQQSRQSDQPSPVRRRRMNQVSSEAFLCSPSVSTSSAYFVGSLEPLHDDDNRQELELVAVRHTTTCAMSNQGFVRFGALNTRQCQSDSEDNDTKHSSTRSSFADSEDDDTDELMFDLHL